MTPSLLIVDDALTVTQATRSLLEHTGTRSDDIVTAHTAVEAMRAFEEHQPETVLLDIDLPDMGGHELAKDLRKARPNARIVVVSALSPGDHRLEAVLGDESIDVVEKPLEHQDLRDLGLLPSVNS